MRGAGGRRARGGGGPGRAEAGALPRVLSLPESRRASWGLSRAACWEVPSSEAPPPLPQAQLCPLPQPGPSPGSAAGDPLRP